MSRYRLRMTKRAVTLALVSLAITSASSVLAADDAPLNDDDIERSRAAFRAVYPDVELGNWAPAAAELADLEQYVLWPDLRAAWFKAKLANADRNDVESFLARYGVLRPARDLRYRYAMHLADEGDLDDYYAIYEQYYQGLGIDKLDCLALQAEIAAGRSGRVVSRGLELWMVGRSQADECDPVFTDLRQRNHLTNEHDAARYELAVDEEQFRLARYLSRRLDPSFREQANDWIAAADDAGAFIESRSGMSDSALLRRQLVYAVRRLAYGDPLEARQYWNALRNRFAFESNVVDDTDRYIALWSARSHLPEATALLSALSGGAVNTETGRWLVRSNLLRGDWTETLRAIDALPTEESARNEWQYWRAEALRELGRQEEANTIFEELASERDYHGFLAADAIGQPYAMADASLDERSDDAALLESMTEIVRARELFLVGLEARGRSEWDSVVSQLDSEMKLQAALLAHGWGWHSRAISTVANAGHFDDLQIRYPLPWRDVFGRHAATAGISDSWAYGVARSESLFMRDIRSSAGAIGIMQLMPATGRETARSLQLKWSGLATLTDSDSNIRLGTTYLSYMYERFDGNRVLATAAYNAGPHRVENWLPTSGSLDPRIWIANIPFNETRQYVRRVLTDEAIFQWRLTGRPRRIAASLPDIVPADSRATLSN